MEPEGEYLKQLFVRPLPGSIDHSLLFGHRGGYSLLRPSSDGTVTLASQLRPQAQAEARLVMGFDEDHGSILSSPPVLAQVYRLLDTGDLLAAEPGGRIVPRFTLADPKHSLAGAVTALVSYRVGKDQRERSPLILPLWMSDVGRAMGPIPLGEYDVHIVAGGFKGVPRGQRITVTADGVPPLR